jgi:GTP-binding protein HflX
MLLATLDPTMRAVELPGGRRVILSDTVGFIADLPTQLIAAFRATLEEVLAADLILHVRDISHPESLHQAQNVRDVLKDLGVDEQAQSAMIEVWNKSDRLSADATVAVGTAAARNPDVVVASALSGQGLDALLALIGERLTAAAFDENVHVGFDDGRRRSWLFARNLVQSETMVDDGYMLSVRWSDKDRNRFRAL